MNHRFSFVFKLILPTICLMWAFASQANTFVFIRHGEKPLQGLGQLNCQGLQRSLKLPPVLISRYGNPQELIAPNPGAIKQDKGVDFYYIRPLATIEPTAIYLEKPVNVQFSWLETTELAQYLQKSKNGMTFIAWEHHKIVEVVNKLLVAYGSDKKAPAWADDDFDSIYKLSVFENGSAVFTQEKQGLTSELNNICPML